MASVMIAKRTPQRHDVDARDNDARFQLPFARAEMADYLGLTLETVSRQFSRLKNQQIIILLTSRDVIIPDIERLGGVVNVETFSQRSEQKVLRPRRPRSRHRAGLRLRRPR